MTVPAAGALREAKKGAAEMVVLAMLEGGDHHGYELAGMIDSRSGGELTFNFASLYATLYKLEERGLVRGRWVERPGQRRRRYYRITPAAATCWPRSARNGNASSRWCGTWRDFPMHDRDLKYWQRLVEARSAAEGHTLSDEVIAELAMFLADVYQAERAAGQAAGGRRRDRAAAPRSGHFRGRAKRQRASRPQPRPWRRSRRRSASRSRGCRACGTTSAQPPVR